jgi:uncharacterized protein (DUF433 family)
MDAIPINHIEIVDGQAVIRGRRIKAKLVAAMYLKAGATIDEVMEQYDLNRAEVHAALAYYYDNQDTIEQSFKDAETYVREVGISSDELIAKLHTRQQMKKVDNPSYD